MNAVDYERKMCEILDTPTYDLLKKDPKNKFKKNITSIINKLKIDEKEKQNLKAQKSHYSKNLRQLKNL